MILLTDYQAIFNTGPIIVGILCALVLKEPYTLKEFQCAVLSFSGLFLVIKPSFLFAQKENPLYEHSQLGKTLVFISTWNYAILILILRYLRNSITIFHSVFYVNVFNILITLPVFLFQEHTHWTFTGFITVIFLSFTQNLA